MTFLVGEKQFASIQRPTTPWTWPLHESGYNFQDSEIRTQTYIQPGLVSCLTFFLHSQISYWCPFYAWWNKKWLERKDMGSLIPSSYHGTTFKGSSHGTFMADLYVYEIFLIFSLAIKIRLFRCFDFSIYFPNNGWLVWENWIQYFVGCTSPPYQAFVKGYCSQRKCLKETL